MIYAKRTEGFTLVELLTIVSIISILGAIASLSIVAMMRDASISRERDQLVAHIEEARARSITTRPSGIRFLPGGTSYDIIVMRGKCSVTTTTYCNGDTDCPPGGEYCSFSPFRYDGDVNRISVISSQVLSSGVTVAWGRTVSAGECTSASDALLWFDRKGIPRCSNWGLGNTTLTLSAGGKQRTVVIDSAGRTSYEH